MSIKKKKKTNEIRSVLTRSIHNITFAITEIYL